MCMCVYYYLFYFILEETALEGNSVPGPQEPECSQAVPTLTRHQSLCSTAKRNENRASRAAWRVR